MTEGILDRLLATLDVRVHAFAVCHVQKGWRLVFAPMNAVIIHYVLSGHGVLRVGNGTSFPFGPHSILIVPPRIGQSLGTSDGNLREAGAADNCLMMADGLIRFAAGAGEKDIFTACGTISATYNGALGLFDTLLQPLVEDVSRVTRLHGAFQTLFEELSHPDIGTRALSEALMKQCLVLLLRHYLADHGVESPLFAALQDPRLARAITAVLSRPDERHGLDELAEQAGMSRSAFSEQFSRVFGQSASVFIQRVRLRQAAHLLGTTDLPIKIVANSVGYASRSHFSRAFRNFYSVDPRAYRTLQSLTDETGAPGCLLVRSSRSERGSLRCRPNAGRSPHRAALRRTCRTRLTTRGL